ncbi:MAG: hypothetical protein J0M07_07025 [Anaerolineae bacterium]|nr:hypothetical protein [Anaerolineae bacterium]
MAAGYRIEPVVERYGLRAEDTPAAFTGWLLVGGPAECRVAMPEPYQAWAFLPRGFWTAVSVVTYPDNATIMEWPHWTTELKSSWERIEREANERRAS